MKTQPKIPAAVPPDTPKVEGRLLPLVRLRPTVGNMAVMLDVFAGCIETGIFPQPDSPAHHSIRWLVSDSGIKTRRIRTRLAKAKPKNFQA